MFGIVYLGMSIMSDLGYRVKGLFHDTNAQVDKKTGTYISYNGSLKDAKTGNYRYWGHDENGDEVLYNKKNQIVRNITKEEQQECLEQARNNPTDATVCKPPHNFIDVKYKNGTGFEEIKRVLFYLDIKTGEKLVEVYVPNNYTGKGNVKFYALAKDPWHIVRITDRERKREQNNMDHPKNWIKYPEKEQMCIERYNSAEVGMEAWQKCHIIW